MAALAVVSTLASYVGFARDRLVSPTPSGPWQVGHAISEVAGRDDTIVSLYGSAELVEASGLPSPYQHLWSLPMRTLDPDQDELRSLLSAARPRRPGSSPCSRSAPGTSTTNDGCGTC